MLGCLRIDGAAEPDKFLSAQRHCRRALGELDAVASGRLVQARVGAGHLEHHASIWIAGQSQRNLLSREPLVGDVQHFAADVVRASWEADGVDRRPLLGIEELDRPHSVGVRGSLFPRAC